VPCGVGVNKQRLNFVVGSVEEQASAESQRTLVLYLASRIFAMLADFAYSLTLVGA